MTLRNIYQKLTEFLPSISTSKLTRKCIETQLKELIEQQYADAKTKREAPWHWGNNGNLVHYATQRCQSIMTWQQDESIDDYFSRVIPAMSALAQNYRHDSSDHDGYGLGTVRELEEAIKIRARGCGKEY